MVYTAKINFVLEFKFKESPQEALKQIDDRNYSIAFNEEGKKIVKIGVGNCMRKNSKKAEMRINLLNML